MSSDMEKIQKSLSKVAGDEIVNAILEGDDEELKSRLVRLATHENETMNAMQNDVDINRLKEELKGVEGPYKDTLKGVKLQRRFVAMCMESRGTKVAKDDDPE